MPITLMKSWLSARVTGKDIGTVGACSTIVLVTTALNTLLLMGAVVRDISIFELECWLGWCALLWGVLIGRRMFKRRWGIGRDVMARYRAQVVRGTLLASPWAWMAGSHIGELGTSAEVAIFVVCTGMTAGAALVLARVPLALAAFLLAVLGSVFAKCVLIGSLAYLSIAGFTLVYALCLVGMAAYLAATQRQLELNSEVLTNLLEHIPHGVCLYNANQQIVMQNDNFSQLYGLQRQQLPTGTTLQRVLDLRIANGIFSDDCPNSYVAERLTDLGKAYNMVHRLSDGRYMAVGHRPLADGGWVTSHEDVTMLKAAEARISHLAHHDALTDLANRNLLANRLKIALAQVERGRSLELLLLDLDRFKAVNDTFGHAVGDELLKEVALRLIASVRAGDTVARIGGDEFAIVLVDCEPENGATIVGQRLIDALAMPFEVQGHTISIGVSIGMVRAEPSIANIEVLFKAADLAMYQAKNDGGNKVCTGVSSSRRDAEISCAA